MVRYWENIFFFCTDQRSKHISTPTGLSKFKNTIHLNTLFQNENTSQSQGESKYVRNTIPIYPATTETSQMLILRYLTSMGEYQEVSF